MSLILSVSLTSKGFNLVFVDLKLFVLNAERTGRISKIFWQPFILTGRFYLDRKLKEKLFSWTFVEYKVYKKMRPSGIL